MCVLTVCELRALISTTRIQIANQRLETEETDRDQDDSKTPHTRASQGGRADAQYFLVFPKKP